ncbi:MAG TPA: hypothetical protein VGK63_07500, partial [Candidatus Limnocylindrales bacterium]
SEVGGGGPMKMRDWDERGTTPAFGHRGYWIEDVLDALGASEIASFALPEAGPGSDGAAARGPAGERADDASAPRRFLVACELGLLDARAGVDDAGDPLLGASLVPWSDVRDIRLSSVTSLDDAYRHATSWSLTIGVPEVHLDDPEQSTALLELARECLIRTQAPPPVQATSGE